MGMFDHWLEDFTIPTAKPKVYVVSSGISGNYGRDFIVGVYATLELAKKAIEKQKSIVKGDWQQSAGFTWKNRCDWLSIEGFEVEE